MQSISRPSTANIVDYIRLINAQTMVLTSIWALCIALRRPLSLKWPRRSPLAQRVAKLCRGRNTQRLRPVRSRTEPVGQFVQGRRCPWRRRLQMPRPNKQQQQEREGKREPQPPVCNGRIHASHASEKLCIPLRSQQELSRKLPP